MQSIVTYRVEKAGRSDDGAIFLYSLTCTEQVSRRLGISKFSHFQKSDLQNWKASATGLDKTREYISQRLGMKMVFPGNQHLSNRIIGAAESGTCEKIMYSFCSFVSFMAAHMACEVPRLGVELELQLSAYATAKATPDLIQVCNLHRSSWQHQILKTLSQARNQTCILKDTSQVHNPLTHNGNSLKYFSYLAWLNKILI